eukprot:6350775-Alexandrium_andersonii.AAC.1
MSASLVGSEMCIRDSTPSPPGSFGGQAAQFQLRALEAITPLDGADGGMRFGNERISGEADKQMSRLVDERMSG